MRGSGVQEEADLDRGLKRDHPPAFHSPLLLSSVSHLPLVVKSFAQLFVLLHSFALIQLHSPSSSYVLVISSVHLNRHNEGYRHSLHLGPRGFGLCSRCSAGVGPSVVHYVGDVQHDIGHYDRSHDASADLSVAL